MPPFTVASLQTITHSRPDTRPMPVMIPAAGAWSSYMPCAGQRRELEERRAGVEEPLDPLAGQELAPGEVLLPHALGAAEGGGVDLRLEVGDDRLHVARFSCAFSAWGSWRVDSVGNEDVIAGGSHELKDEDGVRVGHLAAPEAPGLADPGVDALQEVEDGDAGQLGVGHGELAGRHAVGQEPLHRLLEVAADGLQLDEVVGGEVGHVPEEDGDGVAAGLGVGDVAPHEAVEPLGVAGVGRLEVGQQPGEELARAVLHDPVEDLLLGGEVVIERAALDAGRLGQRPGRHARVAPLVEEAGGDVDDLVGSTGEITTPVPYQALGSAVHLDVARSRHGRIRR